MGKQEFVPLTPSVLEWAISQSGYSPAELARELRIEQGDLASWLEGTREPNLSQFRRLVKKLRRPSAVFLLPKPPPAQMPEVQYRKSLGTARSKLNPVELRFLRQAGRLQRTLAWVIRESERPRVSLPKLSADQPSESAASTTREILGVSLESQQGWRDSTEGFRRWRTALEATGVLVFQFPMGKGACRGFSIWDGYAPVIAVNTWWNIEARIFTLFHELGHLVTRTNSACNTIWNLMENTAAGSVERWCEEYAASFLLPSAALRDFLGERFGWEDGLAVSDLSQVKAVASQFKISLRATAMRLIEVGAANWELFRQIPRVSDFKEDSIARGRSRAKVRLERYGPRSRDLLLGAVESNILEKHDLPDYLNMSSSDLDLYADL